RPETSTANERRGKRPPSQNLDGSVPPSVIPSEPCGEEWAASAATMSPSASPPPSPHASASPARGTSLRPRSAALAPSPGLQVRRAPAAFPRRSAGPPAVPVGAAGPAPAPSLSDSGPPPCPIARPRLPRYRLLSAIAGRNERASLRRRCLSSL